MIDDFPEAKHGNHGEGNSLAATVFAMILLDFS
jgi:hypothetical protein